MELELRGTKEIGRPKIARELMMMLTNWSNAYQRLVDEDGINWELPHLFMEEVALQMLPYINRLRITGAIGNDDFRKLSEFFWEELEKLIVILDQEEDLMRLTGQWSDREQEIKEYWEETMGGISKLPMRDVKRIASD